MLHETFSVSSQFSPLSVGIIILSVFLLICFSLCIVFHRLNERMEDIFVNLLSSPLSVLKAFCMPLNDLMKYFLRIRSKQRDEKANKLKSRKYKSAPLDTKNKQRKKKSSKDFRRYCLNIIFHFKTSSTDDDSKSQFFISSDNSFSCYCFHNPFPFVEKTTEPNCGKTPFIQMNCKLTDSFKTVFNSTHANVKRFTGPQYTPFEGCFFSLVL